MGDIKKIRKKYSKPEHPWRISRIEEENKICKEFGIPKKTELWKTVSKLESYKNQAKSLVTVDRGQTEEKNQKQKNLLLQKLKKYNLVKDDDTIDAILSLTLTDLLNRRLQTIVFKKGYAKTMKQARQMITHRHILVNNRILTSPSYLVKVEEENSIEISPKSPFYSTDHPERAKESSKRKTKKVKTR
ncbi:MAG: 30S ribosomal protein S4 [Candidatus Woesearchaeota archaeon]|nr:MAG: 30S ribosomal protein S4 [Candidatus Woesearchaeota archaeon]